MKSEVLLSTEELPPENARIAELLSAPNVHIDGNSAFVIFTSLDSSEAFASHLMNKSKDVFRWEFVGSASESKGLIDRVGYVSNDVRAMRDAGDSEAERTDRTIDVVLSASLIK